MIIFECDICGKRINKNEDSSTYIYVKWSLVKAIGKPERVEELFCSQHTEAMKSKVEELKREATHKALS